MGMLSGFETFSSSTESMEHVEEGNHRNKKENVNADIISDIVDSYKAKFKKDLEHPKQQELIDRLYHKMEHREKSLVFVRRVATVDEITRKLTNRYEETIFERIKKLGKKSPDMDSLLDGYKEKDIEKKISNYVNLIASRVWIICDLDKMHEQLSLRLTNYWETTDGDEKPTRYIENILNVSRQLAPRDKNVKIFNRLLKKESHRKNVSDEAKKAAFSILDDKPLFEKLSKNNGFESFEEDTNQKYFFSKYFTSTYAKGKAFRSYISSQNWYKFNLYYLLEDIERGVLENTLKETFEAKRKVTNSQKLDEINESIRNNIAKKGSLSHVDDSYKVRTFLNQLLNIDTLSEEWKAWLEKRKEKSSEKLLKDIDALVKILNGVFRHGSGLLPSYLAYLGDKEIFEIEFIKILETTFPEVLHEIKTILQDFDKIMDSNFPDSESISTSLYSQAPVLPASGQHNGSLSRVALQFRMPGFPYVLVTTDVLKEGEDLHTYCSDVYHYGIAWNPSDMEQRTGRIDRIKSKTYGRLIKDNELNFENSLHVFYPYLQDTLEVYQMQQLFTNMNKFVETFQDVTAISEKESTVSIDDFIHDMPAQNKNFQESKFGHENFRVRFEDKSKILLPSHLGATREKLESSMESLFDIVKKLKHYTNFDSKFSKENLTISGILAISENGITEKCGYFDEKELQEIRRGPYQISLIQTSTAGEFQYKLGSAITYVSNLKKIDREKIANELKDAGYEESTKNQKLYAILKIDLKKSTTYLTSKLKKLVDMADKLESEFTDGQDAE